MANTERKIIRGIRLGSKTYSVGMEDELNEALSADEAKRLSEKGYIEGKWDRSGKVEAEVGEGDLEDLTVVELKDRARDAGIEGFSTMKKAELIAALGEEK